MQDLFVEFDPDAQCEISDLVLPARYEVLPPRYRRPARLRVNYYAAALLDLALDAGSVFYGVVLRPDIIGCVPIRLRNLAARYSDPEIYLALWRFASSVDELIRLSGDGYAVVYRVDKMTSISDIRQVSTHLREELTHWQQNYFGTEGTEGHVIAEDVATYPHWDVIREQLLQRGYKDQLPLLVAEAGARVASGEHLGVGLTKEQGQDFLAHYYLQILKLHGMEAANRILQFVDRTEILRLHDIGKTYVAEH